MSPSTVRADGTDRLGDMGEFTATLRPHLHYEPIPADVSHARLSIALTGTLQ
jgi:hypothetical protein